MILMKMIKKILLLLLLISPMLVSAQAMKGGTRNRNRNNFQTTGDKKRKEIVFQIGAANFLGELGGANQIGTHFVKDFEFSMTRPSAAIAYRYKFNKRMAVKGGLYYQLLSGNDNLTKEPFRMNRNLSFRSNIFEGSLQLEFYLTKESVGHRYKIKSVKGMKSYHFQSYVFLGAGGFWFNPKARYDGKWVALQPLGTEGQGLNGKPKYRRIGFCIPYGIGFKNQLNPEWTIGLEIGMRYTFTDYIDDVSTVYYDNAALKAAHGEMGAYLADPSLHKMPPDLGGDNTTSWQAAPGQVRGHSNHNDAYMFVNITVTKKLPLRRKHTTRSKF
jgi:hypothetical protein